MSKSLPLHILQDDTLLLMESIRWAAQSGMTFEFLLAFLEELNPTSSVSKAIYDARYKAEL